MTKLVLVIFVTIPNILITHHALLLFGGFVASYANMQGNFWFN